MGPVAKLTLRPKGGGGGPLELPYNPETLSVSASADYQPSNAEDEVAGQQFMGRSARTTSVVARLDARTLKKPLLVVVKQVFDWMTPTPASKRKNAPMPPVLVLSWGKTWFDVVLQSATAAYTMFAADGTPTRGELTMELMEVALPVQRQNPTSGSVVGRRSHTLVAGDSLHSVATTEYGDPTRWRDLAVANGIDDPLLLRPGTRLLLPPVEDLTPAPREASPW